jgi:RNA polymerase sigma-70 factor (ECF subfamily)
MPGGSHAPTIDDLIRQHHALLYRYAYRLSGSAADAEDLTQQTYLTAHLHLDQLRDPAAVKSWLCSILRRAFLRSREAGATIMSLENIAEPANESASEDIDEEALQHALNELPEEYRSAVILYYFQELSYKEIAEVLGVPMGTVMSRLARGKSLLKEWGSRWAPAHAATPNAFSPHRTDSNLIPCAASD